MSNLDLFSEMDAAADALCRNDPTLRAALSAELQLEFRQRQRRLLPSLSKDEFLNLFCVWHDRYLAKARAERAESHKQILEIIETSACENPPGAPFRCVCGVEGDPSTRSSSESTASTCSSRGSIGSGADKCGSRSCR